MKAVEPSDCSIRMDGLPVKCKTIINELNDIEWDPG